MVLSRSLYIPIILLPEATFYSSSYLRKSNEKTKTDKVF